jgi:hypothetical protein
MSSHGPRPGPEQPEAPNILGIRTTVSRLGQYVRDKARLSRPMFEVSRIEGMISVAEAQKLYDVARDVAQGVIVEIGSYRGRSTVALALGSAAGHQVPVYAVEPHETFTGILGGQFGPEDRAAFFRAMLRTGAYRLVRLVNLSSEVLAPGGWQRPVGFLFLDGDHSYEGVRRDWQAWAPHLVLGATVALDDSRDATLGPFRLIGELLDGQTWQEVEGVGKIRVIRKGR